MSEQAVSLTLQTVTAHPLERKTQRQYLWMLVPAFALLGALFIYPLAGMVNQSFGAKAFTLDNYREIFTNGIYMSVMIITLRISAGATLACVLLGYPVAYILAHAKPRTVRLLMIFVVLPYFTSVIVRTFAWVVILGQSGIVNQYITLLGISKEPIELLYNEFSVIAGMTYVLLPFMVLTLYTVMRGIDQRLVRAAYSLGASRVYAFVRIFFPLSLPGLAGGVLLVFIMAIGFFITPALMGGPEQMTIAMLISQEVEITLNWAFASALSTVLLLATLVMFTLYGAVVKLERFLEVR